MIATALIVNRIALTASQCMLALLATVSVQGDTTTNDYQCYASGITDDAAYYGYQQAMSSGTTQLHQKSTGQIGAGTNKRCLVTITTATR